MAHKSPIESAGASRVVKGGGVRRLGRPIVLAAAALAATMLLASSASAQKYTTTSSGTNWVGPTSLRWSSNSGGPFDSGWTDYSAASFTNSGTYTFQRLIASGTANIGNFTTGTDVRIVFTENTGQAMNFLTGTGGVATFNLGAGSQVDFGSIAIAPNANNGYTKSGAGTLTMTGGTSTGPVTLSAGNLVARSGTAFGQGALTINGGALGATTAVSSPGARVGGITIGGDFQIGISGSAGSASSTANMTFSGTGNAINLGGATRTITLGNSGSMTFGGVISNGGLTLARNADGANGSFGLSGNNTFADGLTLDSVTVNALTNNAALGAGTVTLQGANANTLNIQGARTIGNAFTIADSAGAKTITNSGGNATINGTITNNDSTGGLTIGAGNGRTFTIGAIDGSGSAAVTFGGGCLPGTVVMTGAGSYTGNTVIDGSTLKMSGAGSSVSTANLVFQRTSGATTPTFDLNGTTQTVAGLSETGTAVGVIRSTLSGGKLIVGGSSNSTFAGTIISTISLALEKVGSGKLTLTGANTYTNGTTITAGELEVSSQSLKGDVNIADANATLTFNQAFGDGTFAGDIDGDGSLIKKGNDALTLTGGNSYSGGTTVSAGDLIGSTDALKGAIVNNATVTFRQAADDTYAGNMSGTGARVKTGAGNLTLTGANTYAAGTTISAGGLTASTGSLPTNGDVFADAGTTLTFDQSTNGSFGGDLSGGGALVKLGSGAVTLSGANTYTGATIVSAGKLLVNGSLANSAVTVGNGATLGGSGTLGGPVTVQSGGVFSPGNSPGALAAAVLDLRAESTTFMEVIGSGAAAGVAGTDYDQIQVSTSGGLSYGGSLDLAFGNSTKFLNGTVFDLFAFTGASIGDFSAVFTTGTGLYAGRNLSGAGGTWTTTIGDQLLSLSKLTGRLTISGSAVPEIDPAMGASALSFVAGVLAMLEQRRKRTAKATLPA
jgi:fibronectin-binding autotransporter adhesin